MIIFSFCPDRTNILRVVPFDKFYFNLLLGFCFCFLCTYFIRIIYLNLCLYDRACLFKWSSVYLSMFLMWPPSFRNYFSYYLSFFFPKLNNYEPVRFLHDWQKLTLRFYSISHFRFLIAAVTFLQKRNLSAFRHNREKEKKTEYIRVTKRNEITIHRLLTCWIPSCFVLYFVVVVVLVLHLLSDSLRRRKFLQN